ncbi:conserved hypothetical protein [Ricinus communis]|uniref:Uncharacterized protein n=1 Tax=Ricinus communis TaxID=3988 RepID=B9RSG8_RICCO|nr:conserved hypothetical protein [Ricinus communis]
MSLVLDNLVTKQYDLDPTIIEQLMPMKKSTVAEVAKTVEVAKGQVIEIAKVKETMTDVDLLQNLEEHV